MQSSYTYDLTPKDPAETVAAVIRELNSSHGSTSSAVAPYKEVRSVRGTSYTFDAQSGEIKGQIAVNSDNQSPSGDNADVDALFSISRKDAETLAETAPSDFRHAFVNILENFDREYKKNVEARRQRALKTIIAHFGKGNGVPVTAPERATFPQKPATPRRRAMKNG